MTWRTLSRGLTSGLNEPRREVVRDEAAFLRLWTEHAADLNRPALPPQVDFGREMVVVVAMGRRPTGGYLTEVVDVELRGRSLRVLVGEKEPLPGTVQVQHETQPYIFVAMPTVHGRVEFRTVHEAARTKGRRSAEGEASSGSSPPTANRTSSEPVRSPRGSAR